MPFILLKPDDDTDTIKINPDSHNLCYDERRQQKNPYLTFTCGWITAILLIIEFCELNLMCMQIWNIRGHRAGQVVFACGDFFAISPSLGQITAETVVSLPKLSSVKIAARWCSVLVRGVGPDQSEARDDTRLCPGPGPRFYPQIAPQLPAWRLGKYGGMCPNPIRDVRGDGCKGLCCFWLVTMTISWPLICQMEFCVYCGIGKGGRIEERKCIQEYQVLVWSSQFSGEAPSPPPLPGLAPASPSLRRPWDQLDISLPWAQ